MLLSSSAKLLCWCYVLYAAQSSEMWHLNFLIRKVKKERKKEMQLRIEKS